MLHLLVLVSRIASKIGWQPLDWELDLFYRTSHVGMRSSILDLHENTDLEKFDQLMNDADVFFSNRRPGYQERYGLSSDELCMRSLGLFSITSNQYQTTL
jgi:crotonobetainyl-CoA:carnitine CoA-transferase CaiB-like acyl-CoA transferase